MTLVKDILVHARKLDPKEIPAAVAAGVVAAKAAAAGVVAAKAAPTQSAQDVAYERMLGMSAWGSPFRTTAIDPNRSPASAFGGTIGGMLSGGH